ncbi:MAG: Clp protease N-terminal domain-containing protein [Actinomycetota bacterium]
MFERFTPHARSVAIGAQEEARQLRHPAVGTEHVLLGLLREGDGAGARALAGLGIDLGRTREAVAGLGEDASAFGRDEVEALQSVGIDLDEVRRSVEDAFGEGALERSRRTWLAKGHLPFTAAAKKALELALREALRLGHGYIGTEPVLLGLVRDERSAACLLLGARGVTPQQVRDAVSREIELGGDRPGRTA